jgi:hypothetical protein
MDEMSDEEIFKEAKKRFDRCVNYEKTARERFLLDYMFANGDADNGWQWNETERDSRIDAERPCLTVNKVRQHNFNIINEAKQNKPAIKYLAAGNDATAEAAKIWSALARHIEYESNAIDAYDHATTMMVEGGWGYVRVITEYQDDKSFDQKLRIVRVPDPMKIYLDPEAQERDKSDSRFGFIFEDYNKEEFEDLHPEYKQYLTPSSLGITDWLTNERVRTAEYFRIVPTKKTLWKNDQLGAYFEDALLPETLEAIKRDPFSQKRESVVNVVEWYYLIGDKIVERNIWPGKYIPIVPFVAEEIMVQNQMDRKSHTRALKDPQRIYNYWTSTAVEYGALQTKTPWLAPAAAIEGLEVQWNSANRKNYSVLTYNPFDDMGQQLPPPTRIEPPTAAPVSLQGMQIAAQEMAMVSGQYDSQMGAPSNERSGKAINERQRMGDRATYHYIDAAAVAIRQVGKIILDTLPRIYTAPQIFQILAEDGQSMYVKIDPGLQQAYAQELNEDQEVVARILNPNIGNYDVVADTGPAYATRREEAYESMSLMLTQAPQLAQVVGDLLFRAADFPFADEAAERLRRLVPPEALGQGPSQKEQMLQQQLQELQNLYTKTQEEYSRARVQLKGRDEKRDIEIYRAMTERLKVLADSDMDKNQFQLAIHQLIHDMAVDNMDVTQEAITKDLGGKGEAKPAQMELPLEAPPTPGARKAPDGQWYVSDPFRPGKHMRVVKNG